MMKKKHLVIVTGIVLILCSIVILFSKLAGKENQESDELINEMGIEIDKSDIPDITFDNWNKRSTKNKIITDDVMSNRKVIYWKYPDNKIYEKRYEVTKDDFDGLFTNFDQNMYFNETENELVYSFTIHQYRPVKVIVSTVDHNGKIKSEENFIEYNPDRDSRVKLPKLEGEETKILIRFLWMDKNEDIEGIQDYGFILKIK